MTDEKLSNTAEADQIGLYQKRFDAVHIVLQISTGAANAENLVRQADVVLKYLLNGLTKENSNGEVDVGDKK